MTQLIRYDAMCRAIDAAYKVDEAKDIRDKARAFEVYAQQAKNVDAERLACEIRLRAERKAGQLLKKMEKARGGAQPGVGRKGGMPSCDTRALSDLGITHDQSSKWQKLAAVPQEKFEAALATSQKPTTNGIIGKKPKRRDPKALWLWGRLLDIEREGLLEDNQQALLAEMDDFMQDDVKRLAPLIAKWLNGVNDA